MLKLIKELLAPSPELEMAGNVNQIIRVGMVLLLVFFGGVGGWIVFVPMASALTTMGEVKVADDIQVVQHPSGGIVKRILVHDGDNVVKGQALIEFEDAHVSAIGSALSLQMAAQTARGVRLKAEQQLLSHLDFPAELIKRSQTDSKVADILARERTLFEDHRRSYVDQLQQLNTEQTQLKEEIADWDRQADASRNALHMMQEQLQSYHDLYEKQYIPKTQYDDLLRSEQDYLARQASIDGQRIQAQQRLSDLEMRRKGLMDGVAQSVVADQQDTVAHQLDIGQQLAPAQDAAERLIVRAPVDGVVFNQRINTIGEVIGGGMVLMELIPKNSNYVIETTVQVGDIRQVHLGQLAELRFTAFSKRSSPYVPGRVVYVSPDRMPQTSASVPPGYLVRIAVDTEMMRTKWGMKLTPGMSANVYLRGVSRTLLAYLIEPVTDSMSKAMREP